MDILLILTLVFLVLLILFGFQLPKFIDLFRKKNTDNLKQPVSVMPISVYEKKKEVVEPVQKVVTKKTSSKKIVKKSSVSKKQKTETVKGNAVKKQTKKAPAKKAGARKTSKK